VCPLDVLLAVKDVVAGFFTVARSSLRHVTLRSLILSVVTFFFLCNSKEMSLCCSEKGDAFVFTSSYRSESAKAEKLFKFSFYTAKQQDEKRKKKLKSTITIKNFFSLYLRTSHFNFLILLSANIIFFQTTLNSSIYHASWKLR
jgi:hypothetical protein